MTAPKNMPTEVLRNMVDNAAAGLREWMRDVEYREKQLEGATRMVDYYTEQHERLFLDLQEREAEEAK